MPDPVTAIVGSTIVGAGTSILGAEKASDSADAAIASADANAQLQYKTSQQQLAFQQQLHDEWQGIFGPVQENLSNYYQNLSADTLSSLGIQNIEKQYTQSRQNLDTALAKRGITDSGATVSGLSQLESARMLGKAEAQTNAPMQVAQAKLGFLNAGLGNQQAINSGISNAYTNQMNILGQQSTAQLNQANQYTSQAAQGYAGIGSSIGSGINTYMMYNALNPTSTGYYTASGAVNTAGGYYGPSLLG